MSEHNITLFEACEILSISKKTISRYIRQGKLTPERIKSQQGTLEYRFSRADIDDLRASQAFQDATNEAPEATDTGEMQDTPEGTGETGQRGQGRRDTLEPIKQPFPYKSGQGRQDISDQTGQTRQDILRADGTGTESVLTLLRETTELLKGQLTIKDTQINTLNDQVHKLIERDRETNILLKGLQDRILFLEPPKPAGETGQPQPPSPARSARSRRGFHITLLILLLATMGAYLYINLYPALKPFLQGGN